MIVGVLRLGIIYITILPQRDTFFKIKTLILLKNNYIFYVKRENHAKNFQSRYLSKKSFDRVKKTVDKNSYILYNIKYDKILFARILK